MKTLQSFTASVLVTLLTACNIHPGSVNENSTSIYTVRNNETGADVLKMLINSSGTIICSHTGYCDDCDEVPVSVVGSGWLDQTGNLVTTFAVINNVLTTDGGSNTLFFIPTNETSDTIPLKELIYFNNLKNIAIVALSKPAGLPGLAYAKNLPKKDEIVYSCGSSETEETVNIINIGHVRRKSGHDSFQFDFNSDADGAPIINAKVELIAMVSISAENDSMATIPFTTIEKVSSGEKIFSLR